MSKNFTFALIIAVLLTMRCEAEAALPVIDLGAIGQLISQLQTLQQQLATAKDQLIEARNTIASLTGPRGMERLLSDAPRNYLPMDWGQLTDALSSTSAIYGSLSSTAQTLVASMSVLSSADLARLTPGQRQLIDDTRRDAAGLGALARQAIETSSNRFTTLNSLITSIATAADPKAILDLQARIAAEGTMLQNDAMKLGALYQGEAAQTAMRAEHIRESAVADVGNLRASAPMGL
jgi:type IV secretion system protein VirB5